MHNIAEQSFVVGDETFVACDSLDGRHAAIFEDDGTTGYFYAYDVSNEQPIQDTLLIYSVCDVPVDARAGVIKIGWATDNQKVALLIDDHMHAVFDFSSKQGYCRTGFPPPSVTGSWGSEGHAWRDSAVELFA